MDVERAPAEAQSRAGLGRVLPRGGTLPVDVWPSRHQGIRLLLWLHVPAVFVMALSVGIGLGHAVSAVLVHLSGGVIEVHFHYFVVVAIVTLYQDWRPLLFAIAFAVVHHSIGGVFDAVTVYNHPAAVERPAVWAGVHALFMVALAVTGVVTWRLNETLLDHAVRREQGLAAAKDELLETLSLLSATLDSTTEGILVVGLDRRIVSYNRAFTELWSVPDDMLRYDNDKAAVAHVLRQLVDPEGFKRKTLHLYAHPRAHSQDTLAFLDGRIVERSSRPQLVDGEVVGRVWSFRDVTETVRLADELSHQALHDSLTDIANEALFGDRVDHALDVMRQRGGQLAVLLIDLDDFKTVNDGLGRPAGDELLVGVSERVQRCVRSIDTVARLGGDEFAVLIEDSVEREEAEHTASRVLEELRVPFRIGGRDVVVGASIGIALSEPEIDSDQLLRNADLAMYAAKDQGKNRWAVYSDDMHVAAMARVTVEAELRRALDEDQFRMHYQPIISLVTGAVVGVEALVRWEHLIHGLWAPGNFIGVAETSGLINPLGEWVLGEACAQVHEWNCAFDERPPLHVSVNLSARQLLDGDVAEKISASLARSGLPPSLLTVEITESAMIQNFDSSLARLVAVKDLGVKLAIDDFGTGYASLSCLQQLPADVVKIDQTFVQLIGQGVEESALARAIVRMARMLQLAAVAEGIETEAQAELLARLGCEYAQGFWFSRPVDAAALTALLAEGRSFDLPLPAGAVASA